MNGRPEVIRFTRRIYKEDEYGVKRETLIDREAYAYITSATQKEFFAGGQIGLKPEIVARVFFGDYLNEEVFSWNGDRYHVYRVFRTSDHVELYAERQKGVE